jgi:hypothetical protein
MVAVTSTEDSGFSSGSESESPSVTVASPSVTAASPSVAAASPSVAAASPSLTPSKRKGRHGSSFDSGASAEALAAKAKRSNFRMRPAAKRSQEDLFNMIAASLTTASTEESNNSFNRELQQQVFMMGQQLQNVQQQINQLQQQLFLIQQQQQQQHLPQQQQRQPSPSWASMATARFPSSVPSLLAPTPAQHRLHPVPSPPGFLDEQ